MDSAQVLFKDEKFLVIIGNARKVTSGPIQPRISRGFLSRFIDKADIVIRMNNIKNNWSPGIGRRTDILAIMNTGRPKYAQGKLISRWRLKGLKEILFVVPPKEIQHILSSPRDNPNPNHGIQFADKILENQGWTNMSVSYTDGDLMLKLGETLSSMTGNKCNPSTGIRVIAHVLSQSRFQGYKVYLVGFGFEGWSGHAFDAERHYIEDRLASGLLHVPIQSDKRGSMLCTIRSFFSRTA
jgi:hypothetical protein